jgi:hypothetical protein
MDVELIQTEGHGGEATVQVGAQRLQVVDHVSRTGAPARPGPMAGAKLNVVAIDALSWERVDAPAIDGRPLNRFERQWGWRYLALAEIVELEPFRADLGVLTLEMAEAPDGGMAVGDWVRVAIDRIVLSWST